MQRSLAIFALLVFFLGIPCPAAAETTWQVVRNVRLYAGPSTLSDRITTLHKPERVTGTGAAQQGNYVRVRTTRGEEGWVYVRSVVPVAAPAVSPTATGAAPTLEPLGAGEMRVHFIDVGQGAAALLEFQCGAVLIDTGGEQNAECDSNARLLAYLTAFFAQRSDLQNTLDLVVLSHPHDDHTRGVTTVLDHFTVRNAVDNGQTGEGSGSEGQSDLEGYAQNSSDVGYEEILLEDIDRTSGKTSAVIDPVNCTSGDPSIRVLWGQVRANAGLSASAIGNPNNNSVVVRVDYGAASFLLTGDLQDVAINEMVRRYAGTQLLDVDVYEAGHHGAKNGTTAGLVQAMSPELAVISMGQSSRTQSRTAYQYGHPSEQTIRFLESGVSGRRTPIRVPVADGARKFTEQEISAAIYGTGWDGTVVVTAGVDGTIAVSSSAPGTTLAGVHP